MSKRRIIELDSEGRFTNSGKKIRVSATVYNLIEQYEDIDVCFDGTISAVIADYLEDHPEEIEQCKRSQQLILRMRERANDPHRNQTEKRQ